MSERLLTVAEAAAMLAVKPTTIYAWANQRRIPRVKLRGGRAVRFRLSDIERIIREDTEPALPQFRDSD